METNIREKYTRIIQGLSSEEVQSSRLEKAFELACVALDGKMRENGDPFIFHALNVADILTNELGLNARVITAVFLHEADLIKPFKHLEIAKEFSVETAHIVENLHKISQMDVKTTGLQAEAFRKLIVSYSSDPRVILIKLADRLEVMRSLSFFFPKTKQSKKSAETLLLYTPLAHKLGLYKLKSELEDLSLRYTEPAAYRDITTQLHLTERTRTLLVQDFVKPIEQELKQQGLDFKIKYRTKSVYSIWNKMRAQNVPFEKVFDVFAIRIILNSDVEKEKDDCWKTYSVVTSRYEPDIKRLRDWITVPKTNGYESLHTTVKVDNGQYVEVQIRTQRMDHYAEHGMAAHWRYKGIKQAESGVENWLENIRTQLETSTTDEDIKEGFMPNEIFVFTPNGDLRQLPVGATVLDFAYDIHGNIGNHCVSAIKNGKNVPIREVLATGDTVEIITSKNQNPSPDWLNIVVTAKAKSHIKQRLRADEAKVAAQGREVLERKLKNWKLPLQNDPIPALNKLFKLKTTTELYVKIALDEIDLNLLHEVLKKMVQAEKSEREIVHETPKAAKQVKTGNNPDFVVLDEGLNGVECKYAKCCNPVLGDAIFGFVTVGKGITIHRTTCPNANRLISQFAYRVVPVEWRQHDLSGSFQTILKITANDEVGMSYKLHEAATESQSMIRDLQFVANKGILEGNMHVFVQSVKHLDMLIHKIQQTKGIIKVVRKS